MTLAVGIEKFGRNEFVIFTEKPTPPLKITAVTVNILPIGLIGGFVIFITQHQD